MLIPSFKDFGCAGNGITNDTANAQAAITANLGGMLYIDPGIYVLDELTVAGSIALIGVNPSASTLKINGTAYAGLNITTSSPVFFEGFTIQGAIGGGTALIDCEMPAAHNANSLFRDLTFLYGGSAMYLANAAWWSIDHCYCYGQHGNAIFVGSISAPDDGDSWIGGGTIISSSGNANIYQNSSGGLKVIGCKLIGAGQAAYILNLTSGVTTSDLVFTGNSVENTPSGLLGYAKDVGHFSNVIAIGNQFAGVAKPINLPAYGNTVTSPNVLI